jgi:MoxR-like ATPase
VARELDAGFAPEALPAELRAVREELRAALAPVPPAEAA